MTLRERAAAWWDAPARPLHAYAIAIAVGLVAYLIVLGPGHLFGTSAYWDMPQDDSRAYLMGYRYFVSEPWHWPLFASHHIDVPFTKSFALSDGVPVWGLANTLIATVIPPWRDFTARSYLGLWQLICYVLQQCLGVAIMRLLGLRSRGAAIVTAVFFIALPSWIERYMHAALSAHFLILWPIYLYLRTPEREVPPRKLQLAWLGELVIASLTNPYHVAMSLGWFGAALVRSRRVRTLVWLPAALACVGIVIALAGYISHAATTATGGFDIYSSNALSLIAPQRSGIVGAPFSFLDRSAITYNQYEGMIYLGLGVLILGALFLPHVRTLGVALRRHPAVTALVVGFWLLSLSNQIYVGTDLVASYGLHGPLRSIGNLFRAPGRFGWVPMYAVIIYLLHWGLGHFATGWKRLVLPALAIVQLVDASGDWRYVHSYTQEPFSHFLPIEPGRALEAAHDDVIVLPSYDCVGDVPPQLHRVSLELEYLASDNVVPINGVYGARRVHDCERDAIAQRQLALRDHTLYIALLPDLTRIAGRLEALGATCASFEFGRACSTDRAAIEAGIRGGALVSLQPQPVPVLAIGDHLSFGGPENAFVTDGWSWADADSRWSVGPIASLLFRLDGEPPHGVTLKLQAHAALCRDRKAQDVVVLLDGHALTTLHFTASDNDDATVRSIPIPDPSVLRRPIALEFKPLDTRSPKSLRCNGDPRELGIALHALWFE